MRTDSLKKEWLDGLYVVVPAFNEEKMLGSVLDDLLKAGYKNIIVVDDGSKDSTYEIAKKRDVIVHRHAINRGLGAALGTGIRSALEHGAKVLITFDSDGQHSVADIPRMVRPLFERRADVVIGSRLLNPKGMPLARRIGNWGLNVITLILFSVWSTDTQSGMRAFSVKAANKIRIRTNRMEVSSEIIKEIGRNRLRLKEVPITVIYTEYSIEHGENNVLNGFQILIKLIIRSFMK